jgi:4-alpha-glucanotransferase
VLPFVIPDECNSPYKSYSTFGGNPYFVNLEGLYDDGLLSHEDLLSANQGTPYFCEFDRLKNERVPLLIKASKNVDKELKEKIEKFIEDSNLIFSKNSAIIYIEKRQRAKL